MADGISGSNGVYVYGPTSAFPDQSFESSNYWVDTVFATTLPGTYTITGTPFQTGKSGTPTCRVHTATTVTQQRTVTAGETASVTVTYTTADNSATAGSDRAAACRAKSSTPH